MTAPLVACPEFDCTECGRHIVMLCGVLPEPRLCASCLMIPGWFHIPAYRAALDPGGHVREPDLAAVPEWRPAA